MRKTLVAAAIAAFTCAVAFGQSALVSLQNQEDSTFYYVIDPKETEGLTAGSPLLASKVARYFSTPDADASFASLAPQAQTRLSGLSEGSHLLVGFFATGDEDLFPVRVVALQVDSRVGERFYALFSSPAQLNVTRGVGKLAQFARPAAQSADLPAAQSADLPAAQSADLPAAGLATIATFTPAYDPAVFTRERQGEFAVRPIAESRYWAQKGTRIAAVRAGMDEGTLRLSLAVPDGFAAPVSYFLYIFGSRTAGKENSVTLEIEPRARGDRAVCLLWQKGVSAPRLVGVAKTTATTVDLDIGAEVLRADVLPLTGENPTVDLTAGWYDKGLGAWEEYYYTTFPASAIPVTR